MAEKEKEKDTHDLLCQAITEDIAKWLKQWQAGCVGNEAKTDIYNVVRERLKNGVEI